VAVTCNTCRKNFCLKHRFETDHECQGPPNRLGLLYALHVRSNVSKEILVATTHIHTPSWTSNNLQLLQWDVSNQRSRYHLLCFKHKQRLYCCTLCIWSWPTISELLHSSTVTPSGWEVVPEHIEGVQLLGALLFQHPAGSLRWQPFLRLEL